MNVLILLARLIQIACGLAVLSFAIGATVRSEDYYYESNHDLPFASIFTGAGIAMFGACGLSAVKRRGDEPDQLRLSALPLFIDCWALILCLAAGIVSLDASMSRDAMRRC